MESINLTWNDVEEYIDIVVEKFKDQKITGVYGLPRGGIVLATLISYRMNVPLLLGACKGCLVVDDISDTGETLKHYKLKNYKITTMFYHKQSVVVPDFWWKEKKDAWIFYPWEKGEIE